MISAKVLVATGLVSLIVAICATGMLAYGISVLRPVIFISVLIGVASVFIGLVGVMTKNIKNDLRE